MGKRRAFGRRLPPVRRPNEGGKGRLSVKLRVLAFFCLLFGLLIMMDRNLRPLIQAYGETAAKQVATRAVNDGVEKALAASAISYDQLVTVDRDEKGTITSIEADVVQINRLKAEATNAVMEELEKYKKQLDYYEIALKRLTGKRVKEKVIYSFCLKSEIPVEKMQEDRKQGHGAGD